MSVMCWRKNLDLLLYLVYISVFTFWRYFFYSHIISFTRRRAARGFSEERSECGQGWWVGGLVLEGGGEGLEGGGGEGGDHNEDGEEADRGALVERGGGVAAVQVAARDDTTFHISGEQVPRCYKLLKLFLKGSTRMLTRQQNDTRKCL